MDDQQQGQAPQGNEAGGQSYGMPTDEAKPDAKRAVQADTGIGSGSALHQSGQTSDGSTGSAAFRGGDDSETSRPDDYVRDDDDEGEGLTGATSAGAV